MTPKFVRLVFGVAILLIIVSAYLLMRPWVDTQLARVHRIITVRTRTNYDWHPEPEPLSREEKRIGVLALGGGIALALIAWFGPRIERIEVKKARSPWDPPEEEDLDEAGDDE